MGKSSRFLPEEFDCTTQSGDDSLATERAAQPLMPALTVLYHRDWRQIGNRALLHELHAGREAALSRTVPLFKRVGDSADRGEPLGDPRLSRQPVRIVPLPGGALRLLAGIARARVRCRGVEVPEQWEISATELAAGVVLELGGALALVLHLSTATQISDEEDFSLIGRSHRMQEVRADIRRIATLDSPVLIRGETGTGKELVARALHAASRRAEQPFVAINFGALPSSLAAAELFGAERGAFTGAADRRHGYFQQARGGTLFLDEIGEAPPEVQALLLRVIETGEFRALGGSSPQLAQARIITATDADLERLIRERAFRAPLLHRLSGCEIHLAPLRERREDIAPLVLQFLRSECATQGCPLLLEPPRAESPPWLSLRLLARLAAYDWPGNVRQLRNAVRQIVLCSRGEATLDLPRQLAEQIEAAPIPLKSPDLQIVARRKPGEISEEELLAALEKNFWDLKSTASALRIPRPSLYMLLERLPHIRTARTLSPAEIDRSYHECSGDLDAMAERLRVSRSALRRRLRETQLR